MSLKLYLDYMSQPSRALYIFFKLAKIPFELCPVALRKGEHLTEEFKQKYNKFQKVPFIHDGDFKLTESIAIVRYVAEKFNVRDPLYPADLKKRALVDEYLEWQQHNTRVHCALYFRVTWLEPILTGAPVNPGKLEKYKQNMVECLNNLEELFLPNGQNYIVGNNISVADLFAACEIEQTRMTGYDPKVGRPRLAQWLDKVRNEFNPYYAEAHTIIEKVANSSKKNKSKI